MKKIGLLTDSKIANLALMKIAQYYKNKNYKVEWYNNSLLNSDIEKLFISKIFTFTNLPMLSYYRGEIETGGTGYDIKKKLPDEIEKSNPDYSIYPDCDYSIQLFSRGCIRKCPFCVVPEKEGNIRPIEAMQLNLKGKYIRVLDNNFFANPLWKSAITCLKEINQPVYFDGIDVRLFNDKQGEALREIKIYKYLHIAWDNPKQDLTKQIKLLCKYIKVYKVIIYVLIGFNSTHEENYHRVIKIKELGCKPFVMPYNKKNDYQKRFARWVNMKAVFNTVNWKDYNR